MDIQITVQDKVAPIADKKPGTIIDHTGKKWGLFRPQWDQIMIGASYVITNYGTWVNQGGVTYYTIKAISPIANGQLMPQATIPVRSMAQAMPQVPNDNQRRLDIFISVSWRAWLENANHDELTLTAMIDQLHKFKSAWLAVFGPSPLPRQQAPVQPDPISSGPDDMNDEIPF